MPARLRSTGSRICRRQIADGNGIAVVPFSCHARPSTQFACPGSFKKQWHSPAKPARERFASRTASPAGCLPGTTPTIATCRGAFRRRALAAGVRPDPYHVWLSEIMLQQTTVEAVKPYFRKFLEKWPK